MCMVGDDLAPAKLGISRMRSAGLIGSHNQAPDRRRCVLVEGISKADENGLGWQFARCGVHRMFPVQI